METNDPLGRYGEAFRDVEHPFEQAADTLRGRVVVEAARAEAAAPARSLHPLAWIGAAACLALVALTGRLVPHRPPPTPIDPPIQDLSVGFGVPADAYFYGADPDPVPPGVPPAQFGRMGFLGIAHGTLSPAPYLVHEWGVILFDGSGRASAEAGLGADLPDFVREASTSAVGAPTPSDEPPPSGVAIYKPLLYFYPGDRFAETEYISISCRVRFPNGIPVFLWPYAWALRSADAAPDSRPEAIQWSPVLLGHAPDGFANPMRDAPAGHWFTIARDVDALTVYPYPPRADGDQRILRYQPEKFLFYDGIPAYAPPLRQEIDGDRIALGNTSAAPVHDVWVIDLDASALRIARRNTLAPGETWSLSMRADARPSDAAEAESALATALESAGLFTKEARGMARIWRDDFFSCDGLWVLWRLDAAEVDRILPLDLQPPPQSPPVRVHLALAPLSGNLDARLRPLIERLRSASFEEREAASREIREVGPIAAPDLRRYAEDTDPEVASRIRVTLDAWGG